MQVAAAAAVPSLATASLITEAADLRLVKGPLVDG